MLDVLPDGLEERFRELRRRPTARRDLKAEREAAVQSVVFGTDPDLFVPVVPLDPPRNRPPARPVDVAGPDDALAGLDDRGRPVLVRHARGQLDLEPLPIVAHPREADDSWLLHVRLLAWTEQRVEIVGFLTSDSVSHVTWVDLDEAGRPVRFATRGVPHNALGKGASASWCTWEGDRCTAVRTVTQLDRAWFAESRRGVYGADGLVQVRRALPRPVADSRTALAVLGELEGDHVFWDRTLDGSEEEPLAVDEALEQWIASLAHAAHRAVLEAAPEDARLVRVSPSFRYGDRPMVAVVTRGELDPLRGRAPAKEVLSRAGDRGIEVLPWVDEPGHRARRSLLQSEFNESDAAAYAAPLLRALDRLRWPGDALPFVHPLGGTDDAWSWWRDVVGEARVDALLAEIGPAAPAPPLPSAPPASREELRAMLRAAGAPESVAGQARWGLALMAGGDGASRLGGLAALPRDLSWPTSEGRALTHMASLDLAEVPQVEGREHLPAQGTLVLFADLTDEGALHEPVVVGQDDRVRLVLVPPGADLHEPEPPPDDRDEYDSPAVLRRRAVRFTPVLMLPLEPQGLSSAEHVSYEQVFDALYEVTNRTADTTHLLLGHPVAVQEDPTTDGEIAVLHLGWDEDLGFEFLDGGSLTLVGAVDDLRAGRWDRLVLHPDSC